MKILNFLILLCFCIVFNSCEQTSLNEITDTSTFETSVRDIVLTDKQKSALDGIISENSSIQEFKGATLDQYVEGLLVDDSFISYDQLDEWMLYESQNSLDSQGGIDSRLSITKNRVSVPSSGKRTIRVGLVTTGPYKLNTRQRNAARRAVNRYNDLDINKLRFVQIEGSNSYLNSISLETKICNDDVGNFVGGADGRAFFPSSGSPGRIVALSSRSRNYTFRELTVLIQHEMGHTLGFVHADFRTRRSCNDGQYDFNPNQVEVIPGTEGSGNATNSIMRACGFFTFSNFRYDDRRSIRRAYNGQNF